MTDLIFIIYEFLTVFFPVFIIFFLLNKLYKNTKISIISFHFTKIFIFSIYISAVFYFTGSGTIYELTRSMGIDPSSINFIPFSETIDVKGYFQNILLFIPLGFIIPFIWSSKDSIKHSFLYGFTFSLLIEISQLFNFRQTDVDDLILNTLGSIIGFILFRLFSKIIKPKNTYSLRNNYEPILYITVMFIGHFLLYNSLGLANLLYPF